MTQQTRRAARALAHLPERDPALAVLALWCAHRDGAGQTRTDGNQITYGPAFEAAPLHEQIGLVAHHVLHVALRHSIRAAGMAQRLGPQYDATLYSLVTDALVNETLLQAGHGLPRPAVTVTGLLQAVERDGVSAISALAHWDADRLYMTLVADSGAARRARDYGTQQGFVADLGPEPGDAPGGGDGPDTPSEADWQGHLARAMQAGGAAGLGIGTIAGRIAEMQPPRTPWEHLLRTRLMRAVSQMPRLSHARPSGRWVAMDAQARTRDTPAPVFQPGQQRNQMRPRIAVGLDTSSSINTVTLALFAAEAASVARRTGAEVRVLGFDETVHTDITLRADDGAAGLTGIAMRQGGGTSYVDVIAQMGQGAPALAVVLTDLDGPFGPAPAFPLLWAVPGDPLRDPPFGRVLSLDQDPSR